MLNLNYKELILVNISIERFISVNKLFTKIFKSNLFKNFSYCSRFTYSFVHVVGSPIVSCILLSIN